MKLGEKCADVMRAVAFLSRIPVPDRFFVGPPRPLSALAAVFPLAGMLVTAPAAAFLLILSAAAADPLLAAFLALALQTVLTGVLHEDGLADSADGLFGGRNRERALEIMKDSRIGSYGAAALFLSFAIRAAALAALARHGSAALAPLALLAAAALSRAAMVRHWQRLPAARAEGVAAAAGAPSRDAALAALGLAVLLSGALVAAGFGLAPLLAALAATLLAIRVMARLARAKIGGHTGDTIGATQQLAEIAVLAALALTA